MTFRDEIRKKIGNFFRNARGRRSLNEISERLSELGLPMSDSSLSRIENGTMGTAVDRLPTLCKAYKVGFSDLIDACGKIDSTKSLVGDE